MTPCASTSGAIGVLQGLVLAGVLLLVGTPAVAQESAAEPAAQVDAFFIRVEPYEQPCIDLPIFDFSLSPELDDLVGHAELLVIKDRYDAKLAEVRALDEKLDQAQAEMVVASARWLKAKYESLNPGTRNALSAKSNNTRFWWYARLYQKFIADTERHELARKYYAQFERVFHALTDEQQLEVLGAFAERMADLQDKRRHVFALIEHQRRRYADRIDRARGTGVSSARTNTEALGRWWEGRELFEGATPEDLAEAATAMLADPNLKRAYLWLTTETALHVELYGKLLKKRETMLRNGRLHDLRLAARRADPSLGPHSRVPDSDEMRKVRMEILRNRARRAQLVLYSQEAQLEAGFKRSTSMLQSYGASVKNAVTSGKAVLTDLARKNEGTLLPPPVNPRTYTAAAATFAIAYRLMGDTLGVVVVQPLVDTLKQPIKETFNPYGAGIQDSVEKAYDGYWKSRERVDAQLALLDHLATKHTWKQARTFVTSVPAGTPLNESDIGRKATSTVIAMLSDAGFSAATDGGIAGIFAAVCETPSEVAGMYLAAAYFESDGNFRSAASRISFSRGLGELGEDAPLDRVAVERILHPLTVSRTDMTDEHAGYFANWAYMAAAIPRTIAVDYVWNFPSKFRTAIQYGTGQAGEQDAYLTTLQTRPDSLAAFIEPLRGHGLDYDELERKSAQGWRLHCALLAVSHEYGQAFLRIRRDYWEREREWLWARHENERAIGDDSAATLTPTGEYVMADTQAQEELELATLADLAARNRYLYLALTGSHAAAAAQLRQLEPIEEHMRRTHGLKPVEVDHSAEATSLEAEAARSELCEVYKGLWQNAIFETTISAASAGLSKSVMARLESGGWAKFQTAAAGNGWSIGTQRVWQTLNPWAGKFSQAGVYNTVKGASIQAVRESAAQVLAQRQNLFSEQDIDTALDAVLSVTEDSAGTLADRWAAADTDTQADSATQRTRRRALDAAEAEAARAKAAGDADAARQARAAAFQLSGDLRAADAEGRRILEDARSHAIRTADAVIEAEITRRNARTTPGDLSDLSSIAQNVKNGQLFRARKKVHAAGVREADLSRLVDADDYLKLHERLFRKELDITTLRRALTRAAQNDPDGHTKLLATSMALDRVRAARTEALLDRFLAQGKWSGKVQTLVESNRPAILSDDPNAKGALNAPGIHSDLVFDFVLAEGAPGGAAEFRRDLETFFEQQGYARPGREGERNSLGARFYAQTEQDLRARGRRSGKHATLADTVAGRRLPEHNVDLNSLPPQEQRPLDPGLRGQLEKVQGFSFDHAQRIQLYANVYGAVTIVRNGNPESLRFFDDPEYIAKEQSCKAKTAKVGPDLGLVVNPRHEFQAAEWDKAIETARASGDTARLEYLETQRGRAEATWDEYGAKMQSEYGYTVDDEGRVTKPGFKGIHGDYDLHGVFVKGEDGRFHRVSHGKGDAADNERTRGFREQFNQALGFIKDMLLHGAQDDWEHPGKSCDPPVTIFLPKALEAELGRTSPVFLKTAEEMRAFYENRLNTAWAYSDGYGDLPEETAADAAGVSVRGQFFRSAGTDRWARNRNAFSADELGAGRDRIERPWTIIPRWQAYAIAVDLAPRLAFLTDPRLTGQSIRALPNDFERLAVLDSGVRQGDAFLDLVDAWLIAHPHGNRIYNTARPEWLRSLGRTRSGAAPKAAVVPDTSEREALSRGAATLVAGDLRTRGSHRVQLVRDLEALHATQGVQSPWRPRDRDILKLLVRMLEVGARLDPLAANGVGGRTKQGIARSVELLEWMRRMTAALYAEVAASFHAEYLRMTLDGSRVEAGYVVRGGPDGTELHVMEGYAAQEARRIAAALERVARDAPYAATAFLRPPLTTAGPVDTWTLRSAIRADIDAALRSRARAAPASTEPADPLAVGPPPPAAAAGAASAGRESARAKRWAETWRALLR